MISMILLLTFINLAKAFKDITQDLIKRLKRHYYERKHKKQLEKIKLMKKKQKE